MSFANILNFDSHVGFIWNSCGSANLILFNLKYKYKYKIALEKKKPKVAYFNEPFIINLPF